MNVHQYRHKWSAICEVGMTETFGFSVHSKNFFIVTWISCKLVSLVIDGIDTEKQVPSQGSRRVFKVSTPSKCPPECVWTSP